jgi:hypothetical protein
MVRRHAITVPANDAGNAFREFSLSGYVFACEDTSLPFSLQLGEFEIIPRVSANMELPEPRGFQKVRLINPSLDGTDLKVAFWVGPPGFRLNSNKLPPDKWRGNAIDLNLNQTQDFPGINARGERRKQLMITLRPGLEGQGAVVLYEINDDGTTGEPLATVAASSSGGGFTLDTGANVRLKNRMTGVANINSGDEAANETPDITLAENFYPL